MHSLLRVAKSVPAKLCNNCFLRVCIDLVGVVACRAEVDADAAPLRGAWGIHGPRDAAIDVPRWGCSPVWLSNFQWACNA
jgi:hypothetical protein